MVSVQSNTVLDNVLDVLVAVSETQSNITNAGSVPLLDSIWMLLTEGKITVNQFIKLIEVADRLTTQNTLLIQAVGLALSHEAVDIARQLVERGYVLHPESSELKRILNVLAQPKTVVLEAGDQAYQAAAMHWLRDHSQDYVGSWVALRGGELLSTAPSRKTLVSQLNHPLDESILITRIPDDL